jgi:hypothetical protein
VHGMAAAGRREPAIGAIRRGSLGGLAARDRRARALEGTCVPGASAAARATDRASFVVRAPTLNTATLFASAIEELLAALPEDAPGMVIVQHIAQGLDGAVRAASRRPVQRARQGSRGRRRGLHRPRADRSRRPPRGAAAERRRDDRAHVGTRAGQWPSPIGGRALPLLRARRRLPRGGRDPDRHGLPRKCCRSGSSQPRCCARLSERPEPGWPVPAQPPGPRSD